MALLDGGRRGSGHGVRLDMTPMVDVAFLLLIFFMSTTSLKAQEDAAIVLPTSQSGEEMPKSDRMVVTVMQDGSVAFAPAGGRPEAVGVAEIGARVRAAAERAGARDARLLVFADGDVPYETMTSVLQAFREAEIYRFSLVTDVEEAR
jgi:biopolymer transport protein ExbD